MDFLPTDAARPHQIQYRDEADHDIDGESSVHFVGNDRARGIEWYKKSFTDDEIRPDVDARHRFRTVNDAPKNRLTVNLSGVALPAKGDPERTQDLQRIDPALEALLRVAEHGRAASMYRDEARGLSSIRAPGQLSEGASRIRRRVSCDES